MTSTGADQPIRGRRTTDVRLQLATILRSRDGTVSKDSGLINAYAEVENPNICYKRAGADEYLNLQSFGTTPWAAQGLFNYGGDIYSVVDDVLIKNASTSYAT